MESDPNPNTISGALRRYNQTGTIDRKQNGSGYKYRLSDDLCRQELLAEAEDAGEL